MQCPVCHGEEFQYPQERTALEIHVCRTCGHELAVHCNYSIPPIFRSKHALFSGSYTVPCPSEALKSHLTIKKLLKDCERFQPSELERQFLARRPIWDLGLFFDIEVERIKTACEKLSIEIDFSKVVED